jgi:hypothetical protein
LKNKKEKQNKKGRQTEGTNQEEEKERHGTHVERRSHLAQAGAY